MRAKSLFVVSASCMGVTAIVRVLLCQGKAGPGAA
jgi:hypothetical protein